MFSSLSGRKEETGGENSVQNSLEPIQNTLSSHTGPIWMILLTLTDSKTPIEFSILDAGKSS